MSRPKGRANAQPSSGTISSQAVLAPVIGESKRRSKLKGNVSDQNKVKEYLTLAEAAALVDKTPSNISYLIQYDRLNRYNEYGERIEKARNGELRVSRTELLSYMNESQKWVDRRMKELSITNLELAFMDVPERLRTKHIHRLHPYLGKFIPQLVEYFLSRYFEQGQIVIDPFCGSGTTLVQASEMGINSVGVDISEFNTLIAQVKLAHYDLGLVEKELRDITRRTVAFSDAYFDKKQRFLADHGADLTTDGEYLKTWFAERSLKEMLFFKSLIPDYEYQDLMRVLLSRSIRSCRLIYHYELATPSRPVTEPYECYKHKGKICTPVTTILPRLRFYSKDTVRRIAEFSKLRKYDCTAVVLEGDSRSISLDERANEQIGEKWYQQHLPKGVGVFSSPPYVGQIDYHEQHRYAYELLGFERRDFLEIGPKRAGKSNRAKQAYIDEISKVFINIKKYMPEKSDWYIVANDSLSVYPEIFSRAGLSIVKTFNRPVEDRTERDKRPYSESIFVVR